MLFLGQNLLFLMKKHLLVIISDIISSVILLLSWLPAGERPTSVRSQVKCWRNANNLTPTTQARYVTWHSPHRQGISHDTHHTGKVYITWHPPHRQGISFYPHSGVGSNFNGGGALVFLNGKWVRLSNSSLDKSSRLEILRSPFLHQCPMHSFLEESYSILTCLSD